jgi:hypothetical protein
MIVSKSYKVILLALMTVQLLYEIEKRDNIRMIDIGNKIREN